MVAMMNMLMKLVRFQQREFSDIITSIGVTWVLEPPIAADRSHLWINAKTNLMAPVFCTKLKLA